MRKITLGLTLGVIASMSLAACSSGAPAASVVGGVAAGHADVQVARLDGGAGEGRTGDLDGVEVAPAVQPELRYQLGERAGDGMLGAQG